MPDPVDLPFLQAFMLAEPGTLDKALPLFQKIFRQDPDWAVLVIRLPA
jgi:hypothetical protein